MGALKPIEIAGGKSERGIVIGNHFDKYSSNNPIIKWMMARFGISLTEFVAAASPTTIHEVGCGEGYWAMKWAEAGYKVYGSDFSETVIDMAKTNAESRGLNSQMFKVRSIYDLQPNHDCADLVVCCEVLEHLDDVELAFEALRQVVVSDLVISVPREPLWRILNMARGKYLSDLGNTPGHVNHWSTLGIRNLAERHFEIVSVATPLPWTMIHCRKRIPNLQG